MTTSKMRFDLPTLASHELAELGMRIRRSSETGSCTSDAIAQRIVDLLWDAFGAGVAPQLALVRLYRVKRIERLAAELQPLVAGLPPDSRCLTLVATRGLEDAWNSVARSEGHRVLPFDDRAALARAPMVAKLVDSLALDAGSSVSGEHDVFFVDDAVGSPFVPAQRPFVLRYGVHSVVGCGGILPDASGFAIVVFSRVTISPDIAHQFATIGLQASLALAEATDLEATIERVNATKASGYERLLRLQEYLFIKLATSLSRDLDAKQQRVEDLQRAVEVETAANLERHQRAQRAMLNVIEDLREARTGLEQRVRQRTADLERINTELRGSNAELEQFAYVASHDLQEPLRTISGYLQLLRERYGDRLDPEGHEFISYGIRGTLRLQELIDALLVYSRVSRAPIDVGTVALDQVLDDTLQAMARTFQESRAQLARGTLPTVRGDPVLLRQLFQNLLSNAIKFAKPEGPRIQVEARTEEGITIVQVRDHGIGFDPKYAEQVFKVFRRLQRKQPGTGIGLAICKKIVERHGGTIEASARPGDGATFSIAFPLVEMSS